MDAAVPELQHGHIPLWNPSILSGMPFMAAHQPAVLYPLNWLFAAVGAQWIWVPTAVVRLFLMGWGLHLFMRQLGLRDSAALWSGISYQLCASGITWLHFSVHNVLAFLPLALYATEQLLATPRGRWFLLLTACLACQFLGGHPETSTLFAIVWGSWACIRIPWRAPMLRLVLLGLAVLAAIGLTLPQLLPTVALIRASGTLANRSHIAAVGSWSNMKYWLLLVNPYLFGTPLGGHYWSSTGNYNEYAVYMGFLTIPFVLVGILRGCPRSVVVFWTIVAFVSLSWRFPLPGLDRIYGLRLLQVGTGIRFNFSWSLAAAVLAGIGVESILAPSRTSRALVVGITTACLALLLVSVYTLSHASTLGAWVLGGLPRRAVLPQVTSFYQRHNLQLLMLVALAIIGWGITISLLSGRRRTVVGGALLLTTLVDLLSHGMAYNGGTRPQALYPLTPLARVLHSLDRQFRIAPVEGGIIEGNSSMTQHLDNAFGDDDLVSLRYLQFANHSTMRRVGALSIIQPQAQRFFDLSNVEFVLSTRPISSTLATGWSLWRQDGKIRIYRNPQVLPRAFAVFKVQVVASDQAITAVYAPGFDPRATAVVEEPIPELSHGQQLNFTAHDRLLELGNDQRISVARPSSSHTGIQVGSYQPEQVMLDVNLSQPALVVLSDSYASGWQVAVDNKPAHLYRANAVFRGVLVGAGRHHIVFRYRPQDVLWGTVGAGVTLVMCLVGCMWVQLRRDRATSERSAL